MFNVPVHYASGSLGLSTKLADAWLSSSYNSSPFRFGKHMDLVSKVEGTLFDYNEDFKHLKQA